MKKIKQIRLVSLLLSAVMLVTSAGIIPISAGASETDAVVTAFRQMRCNNAKEGNESCPVQIQSEAIFKNKSMRSLKRTS